MDNWLSYKPSGEYIFERVGDYGENYWTFIPAPLLDTSQKGTDDINSTKSYISGMNTEVEK